MTEIGVLDKGYVRLVDHMGSDLSVVRAARVSYDADWRAGLSHGSDARLIKYLWENKHTSPFEAVTFTFEVKAPIFIFRQWHRHRTWSFNEVSARYTELGDELYEPDIATIGIQSTSNKQVRDTEDRNPNAEAIRVLLIQANRNAYAEYARLLAYGCPRELARVVLPVATYSRMFATVNLLNLFKFIALRDHPHAQHEMQLYAQALYKLICPIVPYSVAAFKYSQPEGNS